MSLRFLLASLVASQIEYGRTYLIYQLETHYHVSVSFSVMFFVLFFLIKQLIHVQNLQILY